MPFQVTVNPSQRTFTAHEEQTILQAAIDQGVNLPYGCQDGACGSCKCKKIAGLVEMTHYQEQALSEQERQAGLILTCRSYAQSDVVLESEQVGMKDALPVKKFPVRLKHFHKLNADVMLLEFQLPANEGFNYHAGQYVDFIFSDHLRRSYSLATAPGGNTIELHIRHMPGGVFTDQVFSSLKEKAIFRVEGPLGSFYLREEGDAPLIFLASGTGFAPLRAILQSMQQKGLKRTLHLYWGARRPQDLYMHEWLQAFVADQTHIRYTPVVSDALKEDNWQGRTGFVHHAVMQDHPDLSAYQVYACGAPIVVRSAHDDFVQKCHLSANNFFSDAFTSAADKK